MKLQIKHRTTYRYLRPVGLLAHRLILSPRTDQQLRTLSFSIDCSASGSIDWAKDVFGNTVATVTFSERTSELTISSAAIVEQTADPWPVFNIDISAHAYPFTYSTEDETDLGAFAAATSPGNRVADWARAFVGSRPTDTLSLLKDINAGILTNVSYRIRDEEGTQSPQQTLEQASGSCRDIAALFIEAVRCLGFGARAVSGYIYDPRASVDDGGSTHAWAEVYLPGAGWIAFDPTHRRVGEACLIPVAFARNNGQIMPVTGGYTGMPDDFLDLDVSVKVVEIRE
ncbi:transglutaminase family protein [Rhizobium sp. NZLR1b]|uniref:transglutaminase family protein n=1 Tax=unclassified Rhizobium TaxID=2613769 RepID=UPI001C839273|nr:MULTISPECIES: transglutaminase family protein [unclassified Rhizobium]MBX5174602.1 transglutaminase family protein [Rhizobium sp. NZLR1b]MBX5186258.1 transglutaminase family protein [Rhizobium sp. NZLR5]MBX5191923.1 transglutaminase family protein [Rhizobium sp. NZLR3b]